MLIFPKYTYFYIYVIEYLLLFFNVFFPNTAREIMQRYFSENRVHKYK